MQLQTNQYLTAKCITPLYGPSLLYIIAFAMHVGFKTIIEEYANNCIVVLTCICFNFRDNVKRKCQICLFKNSLKLTINIMLSSAGASTPMPNGNDT
jgi:hypothetical protein